MDTGNLTFFNEGSSHILCVIILGIFQHAVQDMVWDVSYFGIFQHAVQDVVWDVFYFCIDALKIY